MIRSQFIVKEEKDTVELMITMFCKGKHKDINNNDLCSDCNSLKRYAFSRLERCKYQEHKPVCKKCTTHCYSKSMKEKIIKVMRYSGPRMLMYHPVYSFAYIIKKLTK